jgi:hypothetical protein
MSTLISFRHGGAGDWAQLTDRFESFLEVRHSLQFKPMKKFKQNPYFRSQTRKFLAKIRGFYK